MPGRIALSEVVDVGEIVEPGEDFLANVRIGLLPTWEVIDDDAHLFEGEEVVIAEAGRVAVGDARPELKVVADNERELTGILLGDGEELGLKLCHNRKCLRILVFQGTYGTYDIIIVFVILRMCLFRLCIVYTEQTMNTID